jgi:sulfate adenylyltransferase subunit 2
MSFSHLDLLEAESLYIFREAVLQCERPALLFSGGKDSITLVHLARKAFYPEPLPFPLLHVDTGHNFKETLDYRDQLVKKLNLRLHIASVEESISQGRAREEKGIGASRNRIQSITLMDAIAEKKYDCCFGGARRDEEKARAKERIFSHRNEFGVWDPKNQRPEVWDIYNARKNTDEHFRVFPLSNWTEMDVWSYIKRENIPLPSLYFAHEREVFWRGQAIYAHAPFMQRHPEEVIKKISVRFRTIGDVTCTSAVMSEAKTIDEVILELLASRQSERGSRQDDKRSESAMEDRKKEGYF